MMFKSDTISKILIFVSVLTAFFIFPLIVHADEPTEPETTTAASESEQCNHNWEVVAFDATYNVITFKCSECDHISVMDFSECIEFNPTNEYFSAVDVNNDGYVNGRDYAYLISGFTNILQTDSFINMFSSKQFLYKESFFFIYLTVMFVISTGFICISIKRYAK